MKYIKHKKSRKLTERFSFYCPRIKHLDFISFDGLFSIQQGLCIFEIGYTWNGCDFARDWKSTDRGSALHDALIWYNAPIAQKEKDLCMYETFKEDKFLLAGIYYTSVRSFMIAKGIK